LPLAPLMSALADPNPSRDLPATNVRVHWIVRFLEAGGRRNFLHAAIVVGAVAPIAFAGYYGYENADRQMTGAVLAKRENISYLVASVLAEKLDRLVDVGVSLSTRVHFGQLVAGRRWDDAIKIMAGIPSSYPYIERVFLADTRGVLVADTPALPGVRGKDFAFRDWYRGVMRTGEPHVSHVYRRTAVPRVNVVAVAIPVKNEAREIIAILVLQVKLKAFLDWFKDTPVNPESAIYIVDRQGHAVLHEKATTTGDILNLSAIPLVQKVLRGGRGVETAAATDTTPERIAAYAPVAPYGWGVILEESASSAFAARDDQLQRFAAVFLLMLGLSAVTTVLLLRAREQARRKADLEDLVADRTRELEAANKELQAFSYSVSHDLRAPLRGIDGFSRLLFDECGDRLDESSKNHLQRIRAATQRMGALIDDLLVLSKVTRAEMTRSRADLSAIAQTIVNELRNTHPRRQVIARVDPGLIAVGDAPLLRVVLENLIGNAWKFTGKTPEARIEFGAMDDSTDRRIFFVRDNGAGFDMTYADKLFGAFQRLHGMDDFPGTGVGLASVQRIITRHGGRIWAEAAVGLGATFYFTLSAEKQPE
jgi:signal transduction histidine kinase